MTSVYNVLLMSLQHSERTAHYKRITHHCEELCATAWPYSVARKMGAEIANNKTGGKVVTLLVVVLCSHHEV